MFRHQGNGLVFTCSQDTILLKIPQHRTEDFIKRVMPMEQAGFKRGRDTGDEIAKSEVEHLKSKVVLKEGVISVL